MILIAVGALEAVGNFKEELAKLGIGRKAADRVKFLTLLGSARILRRVLEI